MADAARCGLDVDFAGAEIREADVVADLQVLVEFGEDRSLHSNLLRAHVVVGSGGTPYIASPEPLFGPSMRTSPRDERRSTPA